MSVWKFPQLRYTSMLEKQIMKTKGQCIFKWCDQNTGHSHLSLQHGVLPPSGLVRETRSLQGHVGGLASVCLFGVAWPSPTVFPPSVRRWTIIHVTHRNWIQRLCLFDLWISDSQCKQTSEQHRHIIKWQKCGEHGSVAIEQATHFSSNEWKTILMPFCDTSILFRSYLKYQADGLPYISKTSICWQAESPRTYLYSYFNTSVLLGLAKLDVDYGYRKGGDWFKLSSPCHHLLLSEFLSRATLLLDFTSPLLGWYYLLNRRRGG